MEIDEFKTIIREKEDRIIDLGRLEQEIRNEIKKTTEQYFDELFAKHNVERGDLVEIITNDDIKMKGFYNGIINYYGNHYGANILNIKKDGTPSKQSLSHRTWIKDLTFSSIKLIEKKH